MEETTLPMHMFHSSAISAGKSAKIAEDIKAFNTKYSNTESSETIVTTGFSNYDLNDYTRKIAEKQFKEEYKAEFMMENNTPHTERKCGYEGTIGLSGNGLVGSITLTDEEVTLIVDVPGVEEDLIEIKQIDNILRIRVNPENPEEFSVERQSYPKARELQMILTGREKVEDVLLDLGRLTISLNRGREVTTFEV